VFPLDDPQHPAAVRVSQTRAPGGNATLLNVLPMQGLPLRENTDYVALVRSPLGAPSAAMTELCDASKTDAGAASISGGAGLPPADAERYLGALGVASHALGLDCATFAAMSVFHTGDPTAAMPAARDRARADYAQYQGKCSVGMTRSAGSGTPCTSSPYCMYVGTVNMPQYQRGTPPYLPYLQWGGGWPSAQIPQPTPTPATCTDVFGLPAPDPSSWVPTWRQARVVVTIPRTAPPPSGYPTIVYVRAGAGTSTDPLVDRGPQLYPNCGAATDCRGPAEVLQSVGFAGITIDGPLVGESRLDPGFGESEDLNLFNFLNPIAMRDNFRQSAVELTIIPDILQQLQVDMGDCEMGTEAGAWVKGAVTGMAKFDLDHLAMLSHSMGSTIAPLALATDPRYRAAVLSGSGGSLIENVVYKVQPFPVYVAGSLLGLPSECNIDEFAPELSLLQWATEPSDSQVYARRMVRDERPPGASWWSPVARDVLMIQGLVDTYILPPIADVMTLGEGLDLGLGPNSCFGDPSCDRLPVYGVVASPDYPSLSELLGLSGAHYRDLSLVTGNVPWPALVPRPANVRGDLTATVVQHRIDQNREPAGMPCANLNGHEVIYESTLARHQYACFLQDFANDSAPQVRASGEELSSCDP
jgi:hypothetical protein